MNIEQANQDLAQASPREIISWAVQHSRKPIVSTNFGPFEAVILHMATQVKADIPVIWVDSGYNTRDTYKTAQALIEQLKLNLKVYTPVISAARRDAVLGGIPMVDEPEHAEFTEQFKLEPFGRALREQAPDIWLTAVRSEQTAFREGMEIITPAAKTDSPIKVAPLLHWREQDMADYLAAHNLPNVSKYFDPTKAEAKRECGLHTQL